MMSRNDELEHVITIAGGYPFYQSSGANSSHKDTWFPFNGFYEYGDKTKQSAWFIKPIMTLNNRQSLTPVYQLFKETNLTDEEIRSLLSRFGGIDGICISYLIGGGFWETDNGKIIGAKLQQNYHSFLHMLNTEHQISQFPTTLIGELHIGKTHDDYEIASQWLRVHAEPGRAIIADECPIDELSPQRDPLPTTPEISYAQIFESHKKSQVAEFTAEPHKTHPHIPLHHTIWDYQNRQTLTVDTLVTGFSLRSSNQFEIQGESRSNKTTVKLILQSSRDAQTVYIKIYANGKLIKQHPSLADFENHQPTSDEKLIYDLARSLLPLKEELLLSETTQLIKTINETLINLLSALSIAKQHNDHAIVEYLSPKIDVLKAAKTALDTRDESALLEIKSKYPQWHTVSRETPQKSALALIVKPVELLAAQAQYLTSIQASVLNMHSRPSTPPTLPKA